MTTSPGHTLPGPLMEPGRTGTTACRLMGRHMEYEIQGEMMLTQILPVMPLLMAALVQFVCQEGVP